MKKYFSTISGVVLSSIGILIFFMFELKALGLGVMVLGLLLCIIGFTKKMIKILFKPKRS